MKNSDNSSWRPTLIIGLGGSGTKTLRYINWLAKYSGDTDLKEYLETNKIMFQAIDTTDDANRSIEDIQQIVAGRSGTMASSAYSNCQHLEVLEGAFFPLKRESIPETLLTMANEEMRELFTIDNTENVEFEEKHIRDWLPNFDIDPEEALSAQQADGGAANQYRPLGRIALFKESEKVYNLLHRRLSELRACTPASQKMQIHIVSSLSGGTGAGMFWDIAFLVHTAMRDLRRSFDLQGSFYLPGPFQLNDKDSRIESNTYASLTELSALKNVRRKSPIVVKYPTGERNLTFEGRPREDVIFRSVFLYDAVPPCGVSRDAKESLQEPSFCRVAENLLARVRSDISRTIQVGRDNIGTDTNSSLNDVESTFVYSTSSTLALDDLGNNELKKGLLRYCLNDLDEKIALLLLDKTDSIRHGLDLIGLNDIKIHDLLIQPSNLNFVNIGVSGRLLEALVLKGEDKEKPGLLSNIFEQIEVARTSIEKLKVNEKRQYDTHADMANIFNEFCPQITKGWIDEVVAFPLPESNNWVNNEEEPIVYSELSSLRDLMGGELDNWWSDLEKFIIQVNLKLNKHSYALNNKDPMLLFCHQLKNFLEEAELDKHDNYELKVEAPVEFHQLRYELGILADWEKDSNSYKEFKRYPPILDHDLLEIFKRLFKKIGENIIKAFNETIQESILNDVTYEAQSLQKALSYQLIAPIKARKLLIIVKKFIDDNDSRSLSMIRRGRDLGNYFKEVDILTDEKEEQISEILEPLCVFLTKEMNVSEENEKEKQKADKNRNHHSKHLKNTLLEDLSIYSGLVDNLCTKTNANEKVSLEQLISEERINELLKNMTRTSESRHSQGISSFQMKRQTSVARTFSGNLLNVIGVLDENDHLLPDQAYISNSDNFHKLITTLEILCGSFSSYWMDQEFYALERLGGENGLRQKLEHVQSEVFTVGMATRTIQTENLVVALPRKVSKVDDEDYKVTQQKIEQTFKLACERVLGISPQFVTSFAEHAMIYYEEAFRPGRQIKGVRSYYDAYHQLKLTKKRNAHFYYDDNEPFPDIVQRKRRAGDQNYRNLVDCHYCTPINHQKHYPIEYKVANKANIKKCNFCQNTVDKFDGYLSHQGAEKPGYCRNVYECETGINVWGTYSNTSLGNCKCCPTSEKSKLLPRTDLKANVESCPICLKIFGTPNQKTGEIIKLEESDELLKHFLLNDRYKNILKTYCCPSCATKPTEILYAISKLNVGESEVQDDNENRGEKKAKKVGGNNSNWEEINNFFKDHYEPKMEDYINIIPDLMEVIEVIAKIHNNEEAYMKLQESLDKLSHGVSPSLTGFRAVDIKFEKIKKALLYIIEPNTFSGIAFFRRFDDIHQLSLQARGQYEDGSSCSVASDE